MTDTPRKHEVKEPVEEPAPPHGPSTIKFVGLTLRILVWLLVILTLAAFVLGFIYQQAGDLWDAGKRLGEII